MASSGGIQTFDNSLFGHLIQEAAKRTRRRINYNFHSGPQDNPHRFLNVFLEGSYVAPHRHSDPPKAESFLVLEGWMALFVFDDAGAVEQRILIGPGVTPDHLPAQLQGLMPVRGVDLAPGVWHTVAAVTPWAVCFEVKPGPWEPASDKEFAAWAPRENEPGAAEYLQHLLGPKAEA